MAGGMMPDWRTFVLAALYSAGTHGIMTLNDFKAIEGDRQMGVASLPVQLGVQGAARTACVIMAVPQVIVILLLIGWDRPLHGLTVGALLLLQLVLMDRFLETPRSRALWYSGFGVPLFVIGMMVSAFALRSLVVAAA
jgi:chlorophyll synthase